MFAMPLVCPAKTPGMKLVNAARGRALRVGVLVASS